MQQPAVFSHQGSGVAPSDFATLLQLNRRISSLEARDFNHPSGTKADTFLDMWSQNTLPDNGAILRGTIVRAIPFLHAYVVHTGNRQPALTCTAANFASFLPIGVRNGQTFPAGSSVLVWKSPSSYLGYIIAVLPEPALYLPDYIQQGSRSSIRKSPGYQAMVNALENGLGMRPQTSGRAIDGRQGEYSLLTETGSGLLLDPFQAYLRINELCGLWLNYFGNAARLAGADLDILSFVRHQQDMLDEGELSGFTGHIIYPHEAAGRYAANAEGFTTYNTDLVQLDADFSGAETESRYLDQEPIYRIQEYTGYLGHGYKRFVVKPGKTTGVRRLSEAESTDDLGLFEESLALDGMYGIRSAKGILLSKHPLIAVPKRKRRAADPLGDTANTAEEPRYAFSGTQQGQVQHFAREWKADDVQFNNLQWVASALDRETHFFNWKSVFPFAYHEKDFDLPQEGDTQPLDRVQYALGSYTESFVDTQPVEIDVDDRYFRTLIYKLASMFHMTDDGSIIIADGYGSRIALTGGQLQLDSAGDILLRSASRVVTMAKDVILRAESNVDVSAANKDVRIKAERNLQVLAGNSGTGGILLESKGTGAGHNYLNRVGDEVAGSGITFLAKSGGINLLAQDLYLRSGVEIERANGAGSITLDSARGAGDIFYAGRSHTMFATSGLAIWHGVSPGNATSTKPSALTYFSADNSLLPGAAIVDKGISITGGGLWASGSIVSGDNIQCTGQMGCRNGSLGLGDTSRTQLASLLATNISDVKSAVQTNLSAGSSVVTSFTEFRYSEGRIGHSELLENQVGFSYRDTSGRDESTGTYGYSPTGFKLLETHWQKLTRSGAVSGERPLWNEPAVMYQGKEQLPWPGAANWSNQDNPTMLAHKSSDPANPNGYSLFDASSGKAKDRTTSKEQYESPVSGGWQEAYICSEHYTL